MENYKELIPDYKELIPDENEQEIIRDALNDVVDKELLTQIASKIALDWFKNHKDFDISEFLNNGENPEILQLYSSLSQEISKKTISLVLDFLLNLDADS